MIKKEPQIFGEQLPQEQKEQKVEQRIFPNMVEIKGMTLVGDYGVERYYEGGVIELTEEGVIKLIGFGFEQPMEYGSPADIINYRYFQWHEKLEEYQKQHREPHISYYSPRIGEWDNWDDKHLEDFVNMNFCLGTAVSVGQIDDGNPLFAKLKTRLKDDLLDKFLITLYNFAMDPKGKFIKERPDLTTEIFKYACRNYIKEASGHTKSTPLIPYLLSHPEKLDFFPKEYKTCLSGLFILYFAPEVKDIFRSGYLNNKEKIEKIEQMREDYYKMTKTLGIDITTEGMKREFNLIFHPSYLEFLKNKENETPGK